MVKNSKYWQKRFEILQEALLNKGDAYYADLIKQYERASRNVQDKIAVWYIRLAENNEVSLARAKQMLSRQELKEFKWTLEEYIRFGKENAINQQWIKELENASARVHISKLEAIQFEMRQQIEALVKTQESGIPHLLKEIYSDGYYQTAYEVQKGLNAGWDIRQLDTNKIEKVISKPWTVDCRTFSDRIWTNKEQLIDTLNKELTQSVIRGDAPDTLIKTIADKFNASRKVAGRLVMTESAYFSSLSRLDSYINLGIEEYEIVATLDLKTSKLCRSLDGKPFKVSEYKVNVTAPPFHVRCRSTTAPHIEGGELKGQRAARDPVTGKSVYVEDMTYPEWYEEYVNGNPQAVLNEKKLKNVAADQKQYEQYKIILGDEIPKTLDDFQNLKYNNDEKWSVLQENYAKTSRFNLLVQKSSDLQIKGKVIKDFDKIDISDYEFSEVHINSDRSHNVTKAMAQDFISKAEIAYSRWNGKVTVYVSEGGCSVVNLEDKKVSTAYKSSEYDDKFKKIMEAIENG